MSATLTTQQVRAQRWAWWAVFAALLAATAQDGATVPLPALLLRGLVAFGAVLVWPDRGVALPRRALWVPALALATVALGATHTPEPAPAAQAMATTLSVVLLFVALLAAGTAVTTAVLRVCIGVGLVHAAWAVGESLTGTAVGDRASAGFFNPNDLAAFIAPLAVLVVDATSSGRRAVAILPWPRAARWAAAALLITAVIATGSRGALLALAAGMGALLLRPSRWRWWIGIGMLLLSTAAVGLFWWRWSGQGDPYAFARLTHIWPRSAQLGLQHPLGVGLSGYADGMRVFGIPFEGWVRYPRQASNAHSEVLNAWVELGWLGLLVVLLAPLSVAASLWRRRDAPDRDPFSPLAHWGVLAALALPALVSASLHVVPVALLAAAWAAHVFANAPTGGPVVRLPGQNRGRLLVGLIGAAALLLALPSTLGTTLTQRAAALRDAGEPDAALEVAGWAERIAPHSLGAALMSESLRHATGASAEEILPRLLSLADEFPLAPEPIERASWLVRSTAAKTRSRDAWRDFATLAGELHRRDPRDARHLVDRGEALLAAGDSSAAAEAFRAALQIEPHCADALARLALMLPVAGELGDRMAQRAWDANAAAKGRNAAETRVLSLRSDLVKMLEKEYPRNR